MIKAKVRKTPISGARCPAFAKKPWRAGEGLPRPCESGVALRFPPQSKASLCRMEVPMGGYSQVFSHINVCFRPRQAGKRQECGQMTGQRRRFLRLPSPSVGFRRLPSLRATNFFSREREMGRMGLTGRMCRIRREGASNCIRGRRPSKRVAARLKAIKHVHSAQNKPQTFICHDFRSKRRE